MLTDTWAYRSQEAAYLEPPDDDDPHDPDEDDDYCPVCDEPDEDDAADRARDEAIDRELEAR
jgi:hypothetical protein